MVFGAAGGKYIATALAQVSEYQSFIYNNYAASLSAKIICFLYSFACFFVLSISSNFLLLLLFFDFDFNFWSVKGKNETTWQTCLWRTKFISHFNWESFLKPLLLQEHLKIHKYTKPFIFNCEVSEMVFCSRQGSDLKAQAFILGKANWIHVSYFFAIIGSDEPFLVWREFTRRCVEVSSPQPTVSESGPSRKRLSQTVHWRA